MMNKIYIVFIIVMAGLAVWGTEKALADTTTIFAPDGTVTVCQFYKDVIVCV